MSRKIGRILLIIIVFGWLFFFCYNLFIGKDHTTTGLSEQTGSSQPGVC
jgi:hypothetical protein